jgi:hypothetical protein
MQAGLPAQSLRLACADRLVCVGREVIEILNISFCLLSSKKG